MSYEIIQAAENLAALLEKENASLEGSDYPAAVALIPEKEALLARLTGLVARTPLAARGQDLSALGQRLQDLASRNQSLLRQAVDVQAKVVQIVAGARSKPEAQLYTNDPRLASAARRAGRAFAGGA